MNNEKKFTVASRSWMGFGRMRFGMATKPRPIVSAPNCAVLQRGFEMLISKIVSGGQTGVDRGAIEAACELGWHIS